MRELEARKGAVLQELRRLYDALGAASGLGVPEVDGAADEGEPNLIDTQEVETKVLPRVASDGARLRKAS